MENRDKKFAYDAMARCTKETVTSWRTEARKLLTHGTPADRYGQASLLRCQNGTESELRGDNVGNIKDYIRMKVIYQYDELNQLISENNGVL